MRTVQLGRKAGNVMPASKGDQIVRDQLPIVSATKVNKGWRTFVITVDNKPIGTIVGTSSAKLKFIMRRNELNTRIDKGRSTIVFLPDDKLLFYLGWPMGYFDNVSVAIRVVMVRELQLRGRYHILQAPERTHNDEDLYA